MMQCTASLQTVVPDVCLQQSFFQPQILHCHLTYISVIFWVYDKSPVITLEFFYHIHVIAWTCECMFYVGYYRDFVRIQIYIFSLKHSFNSGEITCPNESSINSSQTAYNYVAVLSWKGQYIFRHKRCLMTPYVWDILYRQAGIHASSYIIRCFSTLKQIKW